MAAVEMESATLESGPQNEQALQDIQLQLDRVERRQEEIAKCLSKKNKSLLAFSGEENEERGNWSGRLDFILSCIGFAVGLGNVWRFPYLCYRNGGGAFFIPYVIFLGIVGIPLFLVELTVGQFSSQGPLTCWEYAPIFRGIGIGMIAISALVGFYYNTIIAWSLWYLFASFRAVLPWTTCGSWSTDLCQTKLHPITFAKCESTPGLEAFGNGTCYNTTSNKIYGLYNETLAKSLGIKKTTAANDYLNYVGLQVLKIPGFSNIGPIRWDMALCLLLAWIIVYLSLIKGIKSSGKVVYFTAIFPYVVLVILFVNGLLQDGHAEGIKFYITPNLTKLQDAGVWKDAAGQIFFSLSLCYGGMIVFASYNRFHTDVLRDTLIVCFGNCLTSVFAGFVIFSYLGAFAKSNGLPVSEVVDSGAALAFIVYPQAVTTLPVPTLWAILFFLMLVTLGLDSQFAMIETLVTSLIDTFKVLKPYKALVLLCICVAFFIISLVMTTPGGPYILQLLDDFSAGWNVLVIALLECASLWCYGHVRFCRDIETMIGPKVFGCLPWRIIQWWFIACWAVLAPLLLVFIMIFSWIKYEGSSYGGYTFPTWVNAIGWIITLFVIVSIAAMMIYMFVKAPGSCMEKVKASFRPSRFWGPYLVQHRRLVTYVPNFDLDPYDRDVRDSKNMYVVSGPQGITNTGMEMEESTRW